MDLLAFKSLIFLLSFIGSCVGDDILPTGPVDVILGRNLTLKILVEKNADDIIIWNYSDGKVQKNIGTLRPTGTSISQEYKARASINSTNGYLTLKTLKPADSGDYSINLVSTTTETAEVKVRVLEPVSKVVIKSNLPEAVENNSTVELNCTAEGSFLNFIWTNNTKPIVIDGNRLTETKADLSSKLTIRNVLRSDLVGPIYCTAANTLETEKSKPFNLTVYYGPEEVSLNPATPPQYITSKSNYSLTCLVSSYPTPTFTWYHNEAPIQNSGPILTLKTLQDQGLGKTQANYKCTVLNPKTLRIVTSPVVTFSVMEPIEGAKVTGPTAVLIANNSTANLSCTATMGVVKDITWMKDGKALSPSARVVFSTDRSSVRFESVEKDDNGKYTCKLANPVNSEEAYFQMVVNYGPEEVKVNGVAEVELDDTVTLTCEVKSVPVATYTWRLNNTVLPEKTKTFSIEKAAYKDSGNYMCEAYNPITGKKESSSHFLSVKEEIDHGLSDGAIAGIVIACLVAAGASIALFFYCRQKVPVESPY